MGARYLDPKYSRWLSTDPTLSSYIEKNYEGSSGGIYNSVNLNLYHYGGNNPIKYVDPDGKEIFPTDGSGALQPIYEDIVVDATTSTAETSMSTASKFGLLGFITLFCLSLQGSQIHPAIPPTYWQDENGQVVTPNGLKFNTIGQAWFYYNKNADWVRPKGYKPKKTTSVFWTGMGDMGRFIAEYWARNHGGKTLEMTLEESGIELPDYTDETKQLWAEASKSFADSAYGDVILINKGFISNSSMWKTIEYEALIKK